MAVYFHKLFAAYLLFQLHLFLAISDDFWQYTNCNNEEYQDNSNNLNNLLDRIATGARNNHGYFNDTISTNPNQVYYGLMMCYADANWTSCNECLSPVNLMQITRTCPSSSDATFWSVAPTSCFIRYSYNENFFSIVDTTVLWAVNNTRIFPDHELFAHARDTLFRRLITEANSSKYLVVSGVERINATDNIYGLLQCTRDLNHTECNQCFNSFIEQMAIWVTNNSQGARLHGNSCFLRYEIYPFVQTDIIGGKESHTAQIVAVAAGFGAFLVIMTICIWYQRKWYLLRRSESTLLLRKEMEHVTQDFRMYELTTIVNATNNFSDKNMLGGGGFGQVYKGTLPDSQELAVKRLSKNSNQGATEFKTEVNLLMRARHNNLVRLVGCCIVEHERILCYEFLPNGSLDKILFGPEGTKSMELNWDRRYKIIKGISRGLLYLHVESPLKIVHRDLKAGNILLDKDMNPKISDFGLARLFDREQTHKDTCNMAGTFGYMAPELCLHGTFSDKSDVYSFGILILEIVTGRKSPLVQDRCLTNYVWKLWTEHKVVELKDQTLDEECTEEVIKCIHIALLCLQANPANRPNMEGVANMLSSSSSESLPSLPPPRFIWGADDSLFEDNEDVVANLSREYSTVGVSTTIYSFLSSFRHRA